MDVNRHKYLMLQILKDVFTDSDLTQYLAFKGGTCAMFFHGLSRFSTDLDFNLLIPGKETIAFNKMKSIVLKYGRIDDEAMKFFGPVIVLDYGIGERKLKIEISNRVYDNHYEIRNYLGINMRIMVIEDMFAHKLCALLDRNEMTSRDVFDCWFFLDKGIAVNKSIVETRMGLPLKEYVIKCADAVEHLNNASLVQGLGELADPKIKPFIKTKMKTEVAAMLRIFAEFPIIV